MAFTSFDFIVFVLFVTIVYYMVPAGIQWLFLLICSYCFYISSGITGVICLVASTIISWSGSLAVKVISQEKKNVRRMVFTAFLVLTLLPLILTKYLGIGGEFMPLGISFYVFMSASYLIDVFMGKSEPEKNIFKYSLYTGFYPLLSQGPITRYSHLSEQLFSKHTLKRENIEQGIVRIAFGYFKKLLIADRLAQLITPLTDSPESYKGAWYFLVMILYTVRLYADFSGGIDITIGAARLLGISLPENFMRPLFSTSISDFWRRWHITMGSWFRDYIYIPLGGNRVSKARLIFNLFIVWLTTGIWHGKGLNYVLWGLLNFVILAGSRLLDKPFKAFREKTGLGKLFIYRLFQMIRTYLFAACFFTLFCYRTVSEAMGGFVSMFTEHNWNIFTEGQIFTDSFGKTDLIIVIIALVFVWLVGMIQEHKKESFAEKLPYFVKSVAVILFILVIVVFGAYGKGYDASAFIYNRF